MRHFGRRPLGSATSLPAMLNLGMGHRAEATHVQEDGREEKPETKMEEKRRSENYYRYI